MVAERPVPDTVDYSEMLNADALDIEDMLKQLRETGLCAVEGIIKEPFRQKLCGEADAYFNSVPKAEIEVRSVPVCPWPRCCLVLGIFRRG